MRVHYSVVGGMSILGTLDRSMLQNLGTINWRNHPSVGPFRLPYGGSLKGCGGLSKLVLFFILSAWRHHKEVKAEVLDSRWNWE